MDCHGEVLSSKGEWWWSSDTLTLLSPLPTLFCYIKPHWRLLLGQNFPSIHLHYNPTSPISRQDFNSSITNLIHHEFPINSTPNSRFISLCPILHPISFSSLHQSPKPRIPIRPPSNPQQKTPKHFKACLRFLLSSEDWKKQCSKHLTAVTCWWLFLFCLLTELRWSWKYANSIL